MPYKHDYRTSVKDVNNDMWARELSRDLRCDGCDERCKLSMRLKTNGEYNYHFGRQSFHMCPTMYAGDTELFESERQPKVSMAVTGFVVSFPAAEQTFQYAMAYCRKTCLNSKWR